MCHLNVVVVFPYKLLTVFLELWQTFGMPHKLLKLLIHTLVCWLHVYYWAQLLFADKIVIIGFATSHAHNPCLMASSGFMDGV